MNIPFISPKDIAGHLSWKKTADALEAGHKGAKVNLGDLLLRQDDDSILNRAAWIKGVGIALKSMTIFPKNTILTSPLPAIQGILILFDDTTGAVKALIDGPFVTKWKTAGDSILGARFLARPDSKRLTIVGSGPVAASLIQAYSEIFPALEHISIWSRNFNNAQKLVEQSTNHCKIDVVNSLPEAVAASDIVSTATLSTTPLLQGRWIKPGTHVDLIGAFRPDMREADDTLMQTAKIFVDARATTIHEIGELMIPLANGIITEEDIVGDLTDLCLGSAGRQNDKEITVFKNGGGAHLDLMTAHMIYNVWKNLN